MILSHARSKKHKLHKVFTSFDMHAVMHTLGTRQITDFFYQSESVAGFYPHSSTAEATMLIRMFNVHVKRFICAN